MLDFERQGQDDIAFVLDAMTARDLTDDSNVLYVQGSAGDTVSMLGTWTRDAGTHYGADGRAYHLFTTVSQGETVAVYVDSDITLVLA